MGIKGFQGTSLLDFPGRIASLVFFGGCNLTCPFCHNPTLVLDPDQHPDIPAAALLEELRERRSFIDGVVVTGGEPTIDPGLLPFLREVKGLGLLVKLDTNGLAPQVLEKALAEKLVDHIALDLKTAPQRYGELHPGPIDPSALRRSIDLVLAAGVEYELRTTCVPGLVEESDIRALGELARGARKW
ncbi:MAG: anaerobic ribonucleoside-triphosphate reductase activating protein, partial [Desulfuromonadales bacterium]|nr:anaerobic ribonucleoside-triphosphate reductase activating protein [Desulfuromonadales bacterium]